MIKFIKNLLRCCFLIMILSVTQGQAEEIKDLKIQQLETLLQTYIEENIRLKKQLEELKSAANNINVTDVEKNLNACKANLSSCSDEELCKIATYEDWYKKNEFHWKRVGPGAKFSIEAKRRKLSCGVPKSNEKQSPQLSEANIGDVCLNNLNNCDPVELCKIASYKVGNKNYWSNNNSHKKYIEAAKRRNISCGVIDLERQAKKEQEEQERKELEEEMKADEEEAMLAAVEAEKKRIAEEKAREAAERKQEDEKQKLEYEEGSKSEVKSTKVQSAAMQRCEADLAGCMDEDLCAAATYITNFGKNWKLGRYTRFVEEAKRRGLTCDVLTAAQREQAELADKKKREQAERAEKKKQEFEQELEEGLKLCEKIVQKSASMGLISKQSADVFVATSETCSVPYGNGVSLKTGEFLFYNMYDNIIKLGDRGWSGPPKVCADLYTGQIYRPPKWNSCIDRD